MSLYGATARYRARVRGLDRRTRADALAAALRQLETELLREAALRVVLILAAVAPAAVWLALAHPLWLLAGVACLGLILLINTLSADVRAPGLLLLLLFGIGN